MTFAGIARFFLNILLGAAVDYLTSLHRDKKLERLGYDKRTLEELRAKEEAYKRYAKSYANRPRTLDDLARRLRADAAAGRRGSVSDPRARIPGRF